MSNVSLSGGVKALCVFQGLVNEFSMTEHQKVLKPTQKEIYSVYLYFLGFVVQNLAS